ncbi:type II secretion system protein [Leptotrichia sp. OH3620_COT-345]|uniref:type II secretion system protein n=1 Tax=Leptotrichia sp. OH3620_COT-345 TaxID=2491048 RepID=UPI000F64B637|nr:type II secretion system protein [Leptotrichia sp. OH3620_COT-345]RRD40670.1 type II secretion system protein [Leptotrichia sp. OH3620_COT-345]
MKNKRDSGFTIIEVLMYMAIISILFAVVFNVLQNQKEKQEFSIQKRNISQFIRKIQQYAQYNKKEYIIDFKISEKTVYFISEENGQRDIIGKLGISENISYMTNNSDKNSDFKRKTTIEGNFEKGFSIYLLNKKGTEIYYRISTNTINAAKYPIISIYRAKKPININVDYEKSNLWEEEL